MRVDHVAIVGQGSNTVIDLGHDNLISIRACNCTLSKLKVACSAGISGRSRITISGSRNKLEDIDVTNSTWITMTPWR